MYKTIYEFAASAGALEGFVYQKTTMDAAILDNWVRNLVKQYQELPEVVRSGLQDGLDRTMGRALQSMIGLFGEDHPHVTALQALVSGPLPQTADDFEQEKAEKAEKYGA